MRTEIIFTIFFVLFDPIYPLICIFIFFGPILGFWAKVDDRAQWGPKIFLIFFSFYLTKCTPRYAFLSFRTNSRYFRRAIFLGKKSGRKIRFSKIGLRSGSARPDRAGIGMGNASPTGMSPIGLSPVGMDFRGPGRAAPMPTPGFNHFWPLLGFKRWFYFSITFWDFIS